MIDAKFRDAATHRLDVAGIASGKPIEACDNAHASIVVTQAFKPRMEDDRLANLNHVLNVSYRILTGSDNVTIEPRNRKGPGSLPALLTFSSR